MAVTIKHVEDAYLDGLTQWQEFMDKWQAQFYRPMAEQFASAVMQSLPPPALENIRSMEPDKFDALMKRLGGV